MAPDDVLIPLAPDAIAALRTGGQGVRLEQAVFRLEGPGAVACLQGLLTSDVVRPGPGSVVYGAVLSPKGMIAVDYWVLRDDAGITLVADRAGREPSLELFRRQLPPRLARLTDVSESWETLWLMGPAVEEGGPVASILPWPASPGHFVRDGDLVVARPGTGAPMAALLVGPSPAIRTRETALGRAGLGCGTLDTLRAARVLAGWPSLGREIGEKTLPQEVRYDEIDGVSYTKGCYVGQETVARVHFRGHPNRMLRGLFWEGPHPRSWAIHSGTREVGRVSSALDLESFGLGLGLVRREVAPGTRVTLGDQEAAVVGLPFVWPRTAERPAIR